MYYIGLDVHKKTISYCVKDASGRIHQQGTVAASRTELDSWMKTLPGPWTVAMEATIFTGWIYDHLLPHAAQVKVAHPLMLRAIAAAKKKNDRIDAARSQTACAATSCRNAIWSRQRFGIGAAPCAIATYWYARWCR
jgi:transposase